MIPMIATTAFTYQTRELRAGERFDVSPVEAAALRYQKKADFAPAETAKPKRRRYNRRDLQAQK